MINNKNDVGKIIPYRRFAQLNETDTAFIS